VKSVWQIFWITLLGLSALGAGPVISEKAQKKAQGDKDFIKEEVNDQKEKVLNTKAQMNLYRQLLKAESIDPSFPKLNIKHINEMSSRYSIYSIAYTIDQDRVYTYYIEDNLGKQAVGRETTVYKGALVPGPHELNVEVVYRGNDSGVFSYINDFKIPVNLKKTIELKKNQNLDVEVVGYEKGWALTDFKERPDLKIKIYSSKFSKELQ
jgi:hypothetical protein